VADVNKPLVSRRDLCRIGLIILIALTLVFLFVQSLLPPDISRAESEGVADAVGTVVSPNTGFGAFLAAHIRDIAHFTEYGMLGIEIALLVFFYFKRRVLFGCSGAAVPFFVGFIDESIQILSGRGPSISDVWIDIGGFITFSLLSYAVLAAGDITLKIIKKKRAGALQSE
jgi:VanZ family protein